MKKVLDFLGGGIKAAAGLLGGDIATKAFEVMEAITGAAKTDPAMQKLLQDHEVQMTRLALQDAEGARLLIREAQKSEDPFVRRVRPTFLYLFYAIVVINFAIIPVLQIWWPDSTIEYPVLPEELYWLFGSAFLGYGGMRSFDKKNKLKNGVKPL